MMTEQIALFPEIGNDFSARKWYSPSVPFCQRVPVRKSTPKFGVKFLTINLFVFLALASKPGFSLILKNLSL